MPPEQHPNPVSMKSRLASGEVSVGSWLSFSYPPVCETLLQAGFEWLVIDLEHTATTLDQTQTLIQMISLAGRAPLVRVPANDPTAIKRVMDAGAHGVVVPMVNSREEAQAAVDAVFYPPRGNRGAGLGRAQSYGLDFAGYREWLEREAVVIVQIEHVDAVNVIDEIVGVEGVDAFFVGPYDLSASLGAPGQWDHPDVQAALDRLDPAIKGKDAVAGFHVVHSGNDELRQRLDEGYRLIAYGDDMVFLSEKVREEVQRARDVLKWRPL